MRFLFSLFAAVALAISMQAQQAAVSMTSFNAVARNNQVLLTWNPEQPGVQAYQLEKSKNGTEFVPFGNVKGADLAAEFIETDFHPFEGLSYYRLRITNTDGSTGFSNVVPVKYDNGQPVSPIAVADGQNNVKDKTVLVVVRAPGGEEYYAKVQVASDGNPIECNNPDPLLNNGTYTIIGCSEQELYARQMVVK